MKRKRTKEMVRREFVRRNENKEEEEGMKERGIYLVIYYPCFRYNLITHLI
jgi:hypothetical protein